MKQYLLTIENALKAGNATEHTHRPALKILLEALTPGVTATNEPKRIACGAPDYAVTRDGLTVGYIEAKDVGRSLDEAQRADQLRRYLRSLENLILTDYLEFRWYVEGEPRRTARLARPDPDGRLKPEPEGAQAVEDLLQDFLSYKPQPINTPRDLAVRMARLTHIVRDIIIEAFHQKQASTLLQGWRQAFAKVLIADLDQPEKTADFADMFAQTLAYGLFSARVMDPTPANFSRQEAQHLIPKSNPFLRDFFYQITGPQMDDEPFASFVDDLVETLAHTDMEAVLTDFGRRTRQEDPVVHFYETFLAAYDPKLREARGVYYTPEPVVSYIVRSVDYLLKTRFNCSQGLADSTMMTVPNYDPGLRIKGKKEARKTAESHKVLILDPACGTGTFLYAVIDHIRQGFMRGSNAGMWPGYVKNHLLPRLFGFELLMAPYAVAHFKLSLQLAGRDLPDAQRALWAYHFTDGERLGVYLTNALEEAHEMTGLPLFTQWVADETNAANEVKRHLPIMVVMGNPPYSGHSANKGAWIDGLLKGELPDGEKVPSYYEVDGKPLGERNPKWLQDDYVKFIRFGQWRIERSGSGILAFISNNGYLDNPTFRGMRQQLMQGFTDIYILNLHGNSKKREVAPNGLPDGNVFDIQQGVAIGLFVKEPGKKGPACVHYANLWGMREHKYGWLFEYDVQTTKWELLAPQSPFYLFVPQNVDLLSEYQASWKVTEAIPTNSMGITTGRDAFATGYFPTELQQKIAILGGLKTDEEIRDLYRLEDSSSFSLEQARAWAKTPNASDAVIPFSYRCFDQRYVIYSSAVLARSREEICTHQINHENITLVTFRAIRELPWLHVFVANHPIAKEYISSLDNCYAFPLYLYLTDDITRQKSLFDASPWPPGENGRVPNLNPEFVVDIEKRLCMTFVSDGAGDMEETFGPEDIFHYIYAIFHAPTYRTRYAEFLKIDFPRVPLTSDRDLFRMLCGLGRELVGLHLLESPAVNHFITRYPVPGDSRVEKGYPRYLAPGQPEPGAGTPLAEGRVYINRTQYFEGAPPEVWDFHVGGYQVCEKWLKDRRERQLSYDDLTHYQKVIIAVNETLRLMEAIDEAIPEWPVH